MDARQQINLYQPPDDLSRRPFSARLAAFSVCAVLVALVGIWAYGSWQLKQVQRAVTALAQQQRLQQDTVDVAGAMHAARANPEQLQAQIKELTAEVVMRRRALELLRAGAEGRAVGFSARLAGLARRHVEGLWIDRVVLSGSSDTMTLEGVALRADLVPRYLRDLAHDPALAGARFDELVIDRPVRTAKGAEARETRAAPRDSMRFRAQSSALAGIQQPGAAS